MAFLYIANPSTAQVAYQVNGLAIMPGRPFAPGPAPPFGTPSFVGVPLAREPAPGVVGHGENALRAEFSDEGHDAYVFPFTFPAELSIDDDLLAYAFRGVLLLMTRRGLPLHGDEPTIVAP